MKIGMLGAGSVALSVARHAIEQGHEVLLSNRSGTSKLADALLELGPRASVVTFAEAAAAPVAELARGARVVKAFNNIIMTNFNAGPVRDQARRVLFVSGDDSDAKAFVTEFINKMGFRTIDLGGLKEGGKMQQAGGPLGGHDF
ncbi:NADPH-dependent F420 reductase [Pseudomonas sp. PD9R]|uniref:NADPH-dependent F420 reductase n=1 Tax=Pseudomonas sp. PD9R TaxID=2853534 RepID=UPI001C481F62|nr:NAD(P)-binding domain-containing protein [Pseudomonas sp. PD9R]MBV6823121.1 NAD(P)-binding domain-containing protein [Pseudomonas sp. PD9R]